MSNLIVGIILFAIFFFAISYIIKEKKKGTRCVGCSSCSGQNHTQCEDKTEKCNCNNK